MLRRSWSRPVCAARLRGGAGAWASAGTGRGGRCGNGITANPDRMRQFVEQSIGVVTALVPVLGYEVSTEIARHALESGRGVYALVIERGLLTLAQLAHAPNTDAIPTSCSS